MNKPPITQSSWEKSAQSHFKKAEQGETTAKQARKKERAADAAKTANLRALRLAKEAADKLAAETEAQENLHAKRPARASGQSKRAPVRLIY